MSLRDWYVGNFSLSVDAALACWSHTRPSLPFNHEERAAFWRYYANLAHEYADAMLTAARSPAQEEVTSPVPSEHVMLPAFNEDGSPIAVVTVHYKDCSRTQWSSRELRPAPQPNHTKLLREARGVIDALRSADFDIERWYRRADEISDKLGEALGDD